MWRLTQDDDYKVWERVSVANGEDKVAILGPDELGKLTDMVQLLTELTVGYRKRLVDGGVGASIADQMAKDFHDMMMAQAQAGTTQTQRKR